MTYTQRSNGHRFEVYAVPGTPHCGRTQGRIQFTVDLEIMFPAGSASLSPQGFLQDNLWFEQYFEALNGIRLAMSCEHLAQFISEQIASLAPKPCKVRITLHPFDGTELCCDVSSDTMPAEVDMRNRWLGWNSQQTANVGSTRQDVLAGAYHA